MLKKTIVYEDYNGVERKEDFFFNLSKAELVELEVGTTVSFSDRINKIISTQDTPQLIKLLKSIILDAYGERSADGRRLIKSKELRDAFSQTEAYSILFMELVTDADKASDFINGILPKSLDLDDPKVTEAVKEKMDSPVSVSLLSDH